MKPIALFIIQLY